MKIGKQDKKEGLIRVTPENLEDLWHLERILAPGDKVEAVSWRSFKASETAQAEKKKITVLLSLEKIEFARHANRLRLMGKIISGTPVEFVQAGSYHTIDAEPHFPLSIYKDWKSHQLSRLKQAMAETKRPLVHVLVLDEREALLASLRGYGVNYEWELERSGSKRDEAKRQAEAASQFYGELLSRLQRIEGSNKIILAGPGFAPNNFSKFARERDAKLSARFVVEHCTYADRTGVNELLKKGVLSRVAADERVALELQTMEEFKTLIAKNSDKACYGLKNVKNAVEASAASKVLVLDELLRNRHDVEEIVEQAEAMKIPLMIFSHESEGGRELAGIGGLAAFLRFALQ
ncbi:Peptide chain release factor subunit 1 [uncultured archaeon]|nr:Peptide chain release factor subunit 1 [uncultured archaeon]